LRIGYLEEIENLPVSQAMRNAMKEARGHLEKLGHEIVEFKMSKEEV